MAAPPSPYARLPCQLRLAASKVPRRADAVAGRWRGIGSYGKVLAAG